MRYGEDEYYGDKANIYICIPILYPIKIVRYAPYPYTINVEIHS